MIRPLKQSDAAWAAGQHAALMKDSVFARFGAGFLECFYDRFAVSRHAAAFVYEEDGAPMGVIAAAIDRPLFLRELLWHHGLRMALSACAGLFRADCRRLLFQVGNYPGKTAAGAIKAEMVFITVSSRCRGRGVARQMIEAILSEYSRRGVARVYVTIENANESIRRILLSMGFAVIQSFEFAGKPNELLEKRMSGAEAPA